MQMVWSLYIKHQNFFGQLELINKQNLTYTCTLKDILECSTKLIIYIYNIDSYKQDDPLDKLKFLVNMTYLFILRKKNKFGTKSLQCV